MASTLDIAANQKPHLPSQAGHVLSYVAAIDGLRALAVISVLLFHLRAGLLPGGYIGVDIFFVISGFVVTGSLVDLQFGSFRDLITYFYARRIFRIMPALIVMLLFTLTLADLFIPDAWLSRAVDGVAKAAFFGFSNVTLALQNDEYFAPRAAFNPYLHTWSLGVEEQFYFIFPFIMYFHLRRKQRPGGDRLTIGVVALLSAASLLICAALTYVNWRYAFYTIPSRFWELGVGMTLCLTILWWKPRLAAAPVGRARMLAALAAGLIMIGFMIPESQLFPFPLAVLPVLGTAGLIALVCARPDGFASALLSSGPAVMLGKMSYSLYLWHWPVFVLLRWTVGLDSLLTEAAGIGLTLAFGWLSYRFVERPTRRHRHIQNLPRGWAVMLGLALVGCSALTAKGLLHAKPRLSLSSTTNTNLWYPDDRKPLAPQYTRCGLARQEQSIADGSITIWTPEHCTIPRPAGRLFVIGDSHSLAYTPMLRQFAASSGIEVRSFFASGCPFLDLQEPLGGRPVCSAYFRAATAQLLKDLRPGDSLFLPSLRLPRFSDQMGASETPQTQVSPQAVANAQAAFMEARMVLRQLHATGANIIFEAPLPIFRAPPFRCSDWFNASNPICSAGFVIPATELQSIRRPVTLMMLKLIAGMPGASIWDPFPILCPGTECRAITGAGPLFFDGDHISGLANDMLYPGFAEHMRGVMGFRHRPI